MDVAVLNDARDDLATWLEQLGISFVSAKPGHGGWLLELEGLRSPHEVEATLEYILATHPQCDAGVEDVIEFYVDSLKEYEIARDKCDGPHTYEYKQMKTVGLIACSKSKLSWRAKARELYSGALFRKAANYAEVNYDCWFILSARYGLVSPDDVLSPYDQTLADLTPDERAMWALIVATELKDAGLLCEQITFFFHAGEHYRRHLEPHLRSAVPLQGLGIGQQLAWYIDRGY